MALPKKSQIHFAGHLPGLRESAARFLSAWKWVLLYTACVFLSLPFTRNVIDALEARGLQGLVSFAILFCLVGVVAFFLRFWRRREGRPRGLALRFLLLLACFLAAMVWMTSLTIERIHFFEYGLLAFLCLKAAGRRHAGVRLFLHAGAATVAIGFLDEALQGLLPNRYYDTRDLLLNLTASGLVLLAALALFPATGKDGSLGGQRRASLSKQRGLSLWTIAASPADGLAVLLLIGVSAASLWIPAVRWDPSLLAGCWERENPCGVFETLQIDPSGSIAWRDASGGEAFGTFEIGGNRLDGPLLRVTVAASAAAGDCGWVAGRGRDRYFKADKQKLLFRIEPSHPFRRCRGKGFSS